MQLSCKYKRKEFKCNSIAFVCLNLTQVKISFNINCGVGFQLFTENGGFAALQFRYNLTYLNNKGETDLGEDFLSARLLVSISKTKSRWERRKALRQEGV